MDGFAMSSRRIPQLNGMGPFFNEFLSGVDLFWQEICSFEGKNAELLNKLSELLLILTGLPGKLLNKSLNYTFDGISHFCLAQSVNGFNDPEKADPARFPNPHLKIHRCFNLCLVCHVEVAFAKADTEHLIRYKLISDISTLTREQVKLHCSRSITVLEAKSKKTCSFWTFLQLKCQWKPYSWRSKSSAIITTQVNC